MNSTVWWKKSVNLIWLLLLLSGWEILILSMQNSNLRDELKKSRSNQNSQLINGAIIDTSMPLESLDENALSLQELINENSSTFLLFFSTECSACELDIPTWSMLYNKSITENFGFVGISLEDEFKTNRFKLANKLDFSIFIDKAQSTFFKNNNVLIEEFF